MRPESKRKRERKQKRKQKKLARQIHQQKRRKNNVHSKPKSNPEPKKNFVKSVITKKEEKNSNLDLITIKALEQDDLEIQRYEKLLGIKNSSMDDFDEEFAGLDGVFDRIFDIVPGSAIPESAPIQIEEVTEQKEKEFLDSSSEEESEKRFGEVDLEIQDEVQESEDEISESKEDAEAFERRKRRAAIFGGGVVHSDDEEEPTSRQKRKLVDAPEPKPKRANTVGKYVPPQLRQKSTELACKREVNRLLNRLAASNIESIAIGLQKVYASHPRTEVSTAIFNFSLSSFRGSIALNRPFIVSFSALIMAIHVKLGRLVGSFFVEKFALEFKKLWENNEDDPKLLTHILLTIIYFCNFKMLQNKFIFDILELLIDRFQPRDVDLIYQVIQHCGSALRREDAVLLKRTIEKIWKRSKEIDRSAHSEAKLDLTLELIDEVRTNRKSKVDFEETITPLRNFLRGFISKQPNSSDRKLRIGWSDVMNIEVAGRWWQIGQAYNPVESSFQLKIAEEQENEELLKLSKKFRMNSKLRQAMFCAIAGADDFMHAFERLEKLNLKPKQDRDVVRIILLIALKEKRANPFYGHLMAKLCEFHRHYQFTSKIALWDEMKKLSKMQLASATSLGQILGRLIAERHIPISTLKNLNFVNQGKQLTLLLFACFQTIFSTTKSEEELFGLFIKLAEKKLRILRDAILLFFNQCLKPRADDKMKEAIRNASNAMTETLPNRI